jgi:cell division protein FtsB
MVIRTRFGTAVMTVGLYCLAGVVIAYFGLNAYSGNHGLKAKEDLELQLRELSAELAEIKAQRNDWDRRVALLRSDSLDPDMLDERARAMLDYVHARDLVLVGRSPPSAR